MKRRHFLTFLGAAPVMTRHTRARKVQCRSWGF